MNLKLNRLKLWDKLRDPDYRNAFVSSTVAARMAVRLYNLRKKAGWTQPQLAEKAGMKQARISVLEQGDYDQFTFSTLKKLAATFDVAVIVDFVSFPDFLKWSDNFNSESVVPESFEESVKAQGTLMSKSIVLPLVQKGELLRNQDEEIPIAELTERQLWAKPNGIGTPAWVQ